MQMNVCLPRRRSLNVWEFRNVGFGIMQPGANPGSVQSNSDLYYGFDGLTYRHWSPSRRQKSH